MRGGGGGAVVVASLLSFMPQIDISILRTFRVLRPLRTLSRIKSMKALLNSAPLSPTSLPPSLPPLLPSFPSSTMHLIPLAPSYPCRPLPTLPPSLYFPPIFHPPSSQFFFCFGLNYLKLQFESNAGTDSPPFAAFVRSLGSIGNVFALLAFFMVIFSILAIELMSGSLRGYCYFDPRPAHNTFAPSALSRLLSQQTPFLAEQFNVLGAWNVYVQSCRPDGGSSFGVPSGFTCPKMAIDGVMYNTTCSTKKWCGGDWCDNDWNGNPWDDGGGAI